MASTPGAPAPDLSSLTGIESMFDFRDDGLDARAFSLEVQAALAERPPAPDDGLRPHLEARWGPDAASMNGGVLAMHFLQRFAPVAQRLPRGLAYTAITTMRLERPIGQQEEFNRSVLLYCDWATREVQRLSRRVAALEGALAERGAGRAGASPGPHAGIPSEERGSGLAGASPGPHAGIPSEGRP